MSLVVKVIAPQPPLRAPNSNENAPAASTLSLQFNCAVFVVTAGRLHKLRFHISWNIEHAWALRAKCKQHALPFLHLRVCVCVEWKRRHILAEPIKPSAVVHFNCSTSYSLFTGFKWLLLLLLCVNTARINCSRFSDIWSHSDVHQIVKLITSSYTTTSTSDKAVTSLILYSCYREDITRWGEYMKFGEYIHEWAK